jgi:hypothetical protein
MPTDSILFGYQDFGFLIVVPGIGSGNWDEAKTPFRTFL